jgi:hypothetical protein
MDHCRPPDPAILRLAASLCLAATFVLSAAETAIAESPSSPAPAIDNSMCLACHGIAGFSMPGVDGQGRDLHVIPDKFGASVHGGQACVSCHTDITAIPHGKDGNFKVSCVKCHEDLWDAAQKSNQALTRWSTIVVIMMENSS